MNIESYIAQLLHRYQCVTVPGFGAFLTEIQSAQWIESANSFFPPKKLVSFNANLKNNDGLLANHIAQEEKTSYDYAVSAIQFEVMNWKKALENSGLITIKNVGSISLNTDDNLIFKPSEQINYLTSSFGLTSFVSPIVKREVFEQKIEAIEKQQETIVIPIAHEEHKEKHILKYAAILVLGLGLTGSISYSVYQNQIASQTILVETAVQKQVQNKIQEATFFISTPIPAVTLSIKEKKLPYHVVAGAFRDERNAEKVFKKLSDLGYKSRRLEINKYGLYPVLYGSYSTLSEAIKVKRDVQEKENPEAWVLIESL